MMNTILNAAAFIALLVLSFILGLLGKPTEMGLSILAGAIALSFLNIDKIKRFKGAGFEAEMREELEAIIEKETEPDPQQLEMTEFSRQNVTPEVQEVLEALGGKYTWRTIRGIAKEKSLSKTKVLESLDWLVSNNFAVKAQEKDRWALKAKGRRLLINNK